MFYARGCRRTYEVRRIRRIDRLDRLLGIDSLASDDEQSPLTEKQLSNLTPSDAS